MAVASIPALTLLLLSEHVSAIGKLPPMWARGGELYKGLVGEEENFGVNMGQDGLSTQWMDLPIDHFNRSDERTIGIRYWVDDSCYVKGGPVFVNMGGEGAAGPQSCNQRAKSNGALVLSVEHRFYGESVPEGDEPLSQENLQYLTVEQNLADTVALLRSARKKYNAGSGFAFGGSYSGATCAWFRFSYPEDVAGCISLSGVVNAIFNYTEFDDQINIALAVPGFSPGCRDSALKTMRAFDRIFARGDSDKEDIKAKMNATNLIGSPMGDSDFMYALADGFAMMDQYGSKAQLCASLTSLSPNATDIQRVENADYILSKHYGNSFMSGCFYDSKCVRNTTKQASGASVGERQWRWQKCTQLAYLQAAPAVNPLRSTLLTLPTLVKQCEFMFGLRPNTTGINTKFGADHPKGSNVFFINYSDDPWLRASVVKSSPGLPACMTTCNGCGHCGAGVPADVGAACDRKADAFVKQWLSGHAFNQTA